MKEMTGSSVILPIGSLDIYFSLLYHPKNNYRENSTCLDISLIIRTCFENCIENNLILSRCIYFLLRLWKVALSLICLPFWSMHEWSLNINQVWIWCQLQVIISLSLLTTAESLKGPGTDYWNFTQELGNRRPFFYWALFGEDCFINE